MAFIGSSLLLQPKSYSGARADISLFENRIDSLYIVQTSEKLLFTIGLKELSSYWFISNLPSIMRIFNILIDNADDD